eukprot:PITA_07708
METLFSSQDIWDLVENGFQEPSDAAAYNALSQAKRDLLRDNRKNDAKSLFYNFQEVHESIFPRVTTTTKSKQAWDTLQTTYQGTGKVKTTTLSHGEKLEERRIVEKVLRSLPARFDAIGVAIEETKDLSLFSVDELHASLISHEHRLNRATSSSLEHAFKTQI